MAPSFQIVDLVQKLRDAPELVTAQHPAAVFLLVCERHARNGLADRLLALSAALPCGRCGAAMDRVSVTFDPARALGLGCLTLSCSRHG